MANTLTKITTKSILDGTIANADIADNAITGAKLNAASVSTSDINDDAVTGAKIADDAIDSEHYTDGSIDTAHIADNQVTLAKMAGLARGKVIVGDGNGDPAALAAGSNGQVLTMNANGDAAWAAAAGGTALTGSTNNTITTVTGADAIQGEANLTFDGDLLSLNKRAVIGNGTDAQIPSRSNTSSYTPQLQVTGAWNDPTHGGTMALNGTSDYPILWLNSAATFQDNGGAGYIFFSIKDGAGNYCNTATIRSAIDGTPGNNDSPGELIFSTTPDGTCNPTQKMVIKPAGNVEITDGNLVIGTAGHGIDFSATGNESAMTSELLDTYEEGTFTPTLTNGPSISQEEGRYIRIGKVVHCWWRFVTSNDGPSAHCRMHLPFTSNSDNSGPPNGGTAWDYHTSEIDAHLSQGSNAIFFYQATAALNGDNAQIESEDFRGCTTYEVA